MDAVSFGEQLREIRLRKDLSLKDLAERIGYSQPYISMLENGKKGIPKPETLQKIADGLDVDPVRIMFIAGYPISNEGAYTDSMLKAFGATDEEYQKLVNSSLVGGKKSPNAVMETVSTKNNLYTLLNSDEEVYYKSHLLTEEHKKFIIEVLNWTTRK